MTHDRRALRDSYATNYSLDSPSTLVPASESMCEASEATTLYDLSDTSSSKFDGVKPEAARRNSSAFNERWSTADPVRVKSEGNWQWGADQYPNKESSVPPTTSSRRSCQALSDCSQITRQGSSFRLLVHGLSVAEGSITREHRRKRFATAALTLRLSVLELLFDILDYPVLFTEQRKDFFHKLWLDLDYESSRANLKAGTHKQISELKHKCFLCVLNELPVNRPISEIIPDGPFAVKALCRELAYGTGVYSIQKALKQIARTDWGHKELLRLSPQPYSREKGESRSGPNLIIDCITKLLSFKNGFSHAMAFRIFGRLAECNQEVYTLLAGPMGIIWLVHRLDDQTYERESAYDSPRRVEIYCRALMAACTNCKGLINCIHHTR